MGKAVFLAASHRQAIDLVLQNVWAALCARLRGLAQRGYVTPWCAPF